MSGPSRPHGGLLERGAPAPGNDELSRFAGVAHRAAQLQELTAELSRALNVQQAASVVATRGRELFEATGALVYLIEGDVLRLSAMAGLPEERAVRFGNVPLSANLPLSIAVRTGEALWLEDREAILRACPEFAAIRLGEAALQAIVTVPVRDSERVIGGIGLSFYTPKRFDAVQREFLLTVVSQCGQAMDRARLFESERAARERLEQQKRTLAVLADAGEILSASLHSRELLVRLARIVVPALADWCAIDELAKDGSIQRVAVEHSDPSKVSLAHEIARRYPPDPRAPLGMPKVLRTGEVESADVSDEILAASAYDEEHLALLRSLGLTSYAVVPIAARDRILGALTLVHAESGRRFTPDDVRLASDIARRAALAIENAQLYEAEVLARQRSEALLAGIARNEARLRALVDVTAAIVWTATADGQVVELSPSWLAFTGQTEVEYANGGFLNAIHEADREPTMKLWS
ncbi:MAG TPA: GAF domain-containing protein, partial [Polyangiaceae bacterium]|nr:GAF domain-containing protein [Polyangiaceae bacterium]